MEWLLIALHLFLFITGVYAVLATIFSAVRQFVLPRSAQDRLTRVVFLASRRVFGIFLKRAKSYAERDRVMAFYAPITLMLLPVVWLSVVCIGYTGIYWSLGVEPLTRAITLSGSSLLTLGFATADNMVEVVLAFSEATIGLILVALLIAYLPTMYSAFSRRELAVAMLEVRAGSPPSAIEIIERFGRLKDYSRLHDLWTTWEIWFADIEESHTSLPALTFFRSPQPDRSWVIAAGAVMDAAALTLAALDIPADAQAALCIRGGYVAFRRIADYFQIAYNPNPLPGDAIYISRYEFDAVIDRFAAVGTPLKADREQIWRDFVGWRVNYETVLLSLCSLTMAPEAPWSSDRAPRAIGVPPLRPNS